MPPGDLEVDPSFFISETLGLWANHFTAFGLVFFPDWNGSLPVLVIGSTWGISEPAASAPAFVDSGT